MRRSPTRPVKILEKRRRRGRSSGSLLDWTFGSLLDWTFEVSTSLNLGTNERTFRTGSQYQHIWQLPLLSFHQCRDHLECWYRPCCTSMDRRWIALTLTGQWRQDWSARAPDDVPPLSKCRMPIDPGSASRDLASLCRSTAAELYVHSASYCASGMGCSGGGKGLQQSFVVGIMRRYARSLDATGLAGLDQCNAGHRHAYRRARSRVGSCRSNCRRNTLVGLAKAFATRVTPLTCCTNHRSTTTTRTTRGVMK